MEKFELRNVLLGLYKRDLVKFMEAHPEFFAEAVHLALSDQQPLAWRAAWLLWSCMAPSDNRVRPYVDMLIAALPDKSDGHARELLKILLLVELDEIQAGTVFEVCAQIWQNPRKSPGVRMNALKAIVKIAKSYPELMPEVESLLHEMYIDSLTQGARRSAIKIMMNLTRSK